MKPRRILVPVPVDLALVYDGRSWKLIPAPADWWLEDSEATVSTDLRFPAPAAPAAPVTKHPPSGVAESSGGARSGS